MGVGSHIRRYIAWANAGATGSYPTGVPGEVRRYVAWKLAGGTGQQPFVGANIKRFVDANLGGPITFVQQKSGTTADGSAGLSVTFDTPLVAGQSVIACYSWDSDSDNNSPSSPATLVGGGGSALGHVQDTVNGVPAVSMDYKTNVSGGETGLTITMSSPVRVSVNVSVWSGLANAAAVATNSNVGSVTALGGIGSTGNADSSGWPRVLTIGMIASNANNIDAAITGDLTTALTTTGGVSVYQRSSYLIGAGGVKQGSWPLTDAGDYAACIAAFRGV